MKSPLGLLLALATGTQAPAVDAPQVSREGISSGLAFVENVGQWETEARFVALSGAHVYRVESDALWVQVQGPEGRGHAIRLAFEGGEATRVAGREEQRTLYSYFRGSDPSAWRTGVQGYREVLLESIRPGIDLVVRGPRGVLEYDLWVDADAELSDVIVRCDGVSRIEVLADGSLTMETDVGRVVQPVPKTWEVSPLGERREVACAYRVLSDNRFAFEVDEREPGWRLYIDPGLVWSTFFGGFGIEAADALALDPDGSVYLAGTGQQLGFPVTPGAYVFGTAINPTYLAKLDPTGSELIYSCIFSGTKAGDTSRFVDVAVGRDGKLVALGNTSAPDFPVTPGAIPGPSFGGGVILRLNELGTDLELSTFLDSGDSDAGYSCQALALAQDGSILIAGRTSISNFATPGTYDTTKDGVSDAFVMRMTGDGSIEWSTFLGGSSSSDTVRAMDVAFDGTVTVAGLATSKNFPTTPDAFDTTWDASLSGANGFVARLAADGSSLIWSTFLEGSGDEFVQDLGVDAWGRALVVGYTQSIDFPVTSGAFDTDYAETPFGFQNEWDGFVTLFAADGASLVYSTFLGGEALDEVLAATVDASGVATVAGRTAGTPGLVYEFFPSTPGAWGVHPGADYEAFVARLSPAGDRLLYSTFLGGNGLEWVRDLAAGPHGSAIVTGYTGSPDFPTTQGVYASDYIGGQLDAFLTKLTVQFESVTTFGNSTPSCLGEVRLGLLKRPVASEDGFGFYGSGAPPSSFGVLLLGLDIQEPAAAGAGLWIDLSGRTAVVAAMSDPYGYLEIPVSLAPALSGRELFAQLVVASTEECTTGKRWAASPALSIQVR